MSFTAASKETVKMNGACELQPSLPWHHRDPFDRLLAAVCLEHALPIVSRDNTFDAYGCHRLWA
jgi:PIN domain nuclease of toxin-antitoxin system